MEVTIRPLRPRFSTAYPRPLTARGIGLKDLPDAFYLPGDEPDGTLFAVSISGFEDLKTGLSPELQRIAPRAAQLILEEVSA